MEQHDIVEELRALRQEVQTLKFLTGGGVIGDLLSRVSALESSLRGASKAELDWTKIRQLYYRGGDGIEVTFPPQGYTKTATGLTFVFDKKALVILHAASRGTGNGEALIRINTVTCCWVAGGGGYDLSVMLVKPGDTCEITNTNNNDSMTIREIPLVSIL